jgi:hypothetical protein
MYKVHEIHEPKAWMKFLAEKLKKFCFHGSLLKSVLVRRNAEILGEPVSFIIDILIYL